MRGIVVFTLIFAFVFPVLPALAAKGKKASPDAKFDKLDTNGDGQLSRAEFTAKKGKKAGKKGKAKKGKKGNKKGKKAEKKQVEGKGKKNKKKDNS